MIRPELIDRSLGKNLPLLLRSRVEICPDVTLQAAKNKNGVYIRYSYKYVYERVIEFAFALRQLGIKRGDNIGLIADNRREWLITDLALLSLGAADVPRGCDSTGVEIRFILNYADCSVSFFENGNQLAKVLEKSDEVPLLKTAVLFDDPSEEIRKTASAAGIKIYCFADIERDGTKATADERADIEHEMDLTEPDEVATIIFTSGTTGTPKGVMLTHDNYLAQCEIVRHVLPNAEQGDMWLSVLPVWHSFERAFVYMIMALNSGYAYSKPVASIMLADMEAIKPEWMCGVPRLWEMFAQGFYRAMKKNGGIQLNIFLNFIEIGKKFSKAKEQVTGLVCRYHAYPRVFDFIRGIVPFILHAPAYGIGELLVYRKVRAKLGGHMKAAISGGGALQSDTEAFYHAIGFNLLEGYGMTEAAPVLSVRNAKRPVSNCVGKVFPCVDVKIVAEKDGKIASTDPLPPGKKGLVLCRGRQIMKGYYKRPDLTAQVIDKDGWLNTGDLGILSVDEELKITGRAKDTIVLLGGENVEPAVVEKALKKSPYIETVVAVGQDKKYLGVLIVPDREHVLAYAEENHIVYETWEALLETTEIQTLFRQEIDLIVSAKNGFRTCERIYKFALLPEPFKVGAEINAKQEIMRHKVVQIHAEEMAELFD